MQRLSAWLRDDRDGDVLARPASPRGRYQTSLLPFIEGDGAAELNITESFCSHRSIFTRGGAFPGRCRLFLDHYVINKS